MNEIFRGDRNLTGNTALLHLWASMICKAPLPYDQGIFLSISKSCLNITFFLVPLEYRRLPREW